MFKESSIATLTKALTDEMHNFSGKSSDEISKDVVKFDPVLAQLREYLEYFNSYMETSIKQEIALNNIQSTLKSDVEKEILELKSELEKIPDNSELKEYKKEQLIRLNLTLASLNRF